MEVKMDDTMTENVDNDGTTNDELAVQPETATIEEQSMKQSIEPKQPTATVEYEAYRKPDGSRPNV
jgi:hypothetical protein